MKTTIGPAITQLAKLKTEDGEPTEDQTEQLERWVMHYSKLYAQDLPEHPGMEEVFPSFGVYAELDEEPTEEELSEATSALSKGKAPGEDCIAAEILKENKDLLLPRHALLMQCWRQHEIPHKMQDAKVVTLYKNKGGRGDCNNYRGISLLSVASKIFARVILKRLQRLEDRTLQETQSGFTTGRSTTDIVFTLRQLQEKCREQRKPLFITFADLTKVFDTVSRKSLYKVLAKSVATYPFAVNHFFSQGHECVHSVRWKHIRVF